MTSIAKRVQADYYEAMDEWMVEKEESNEIIPSPDVAEFVERHVGPVERERDEALRTVGTVGAKLQKLTGRFAKLAASARGVIDAFGPPEDDRTSWIWNALRNALKESDGDS